MREEVFRMERVTYKEQGMTLLDNFSMTVWAGEIVGLVPVNHFGLPALLKLLRQKLPLHYGFIYYRERLINHWRRGSMGSPKISVIQNQSCLAEGLTVADNIFVLRQGFRKWLMQPDVLEKQLAPFLEDIEMNISAGTYVENLSPFERFVVELLKAVVAGSRLIVLEDIGNFISDAELKKIQRILRHYAKKGVSFLYIASHFEEIHQLCDRTVFMMDGQIIKNFQREDNSFDNHFFQCTENFERKVLEQMARKAENADAPDAAFQAWHVELSAGKHLDFSVSSGECLVLQDLDNSILYEFMQIMTGEKRQKAGQLLIQGQPFGGRRDRRVAVVQELPAESMLFPNLSYLDNLCFTLDERFPDVWRKKRIKRSIRREYTEMLGEEVFDKTVEQLSEQEKYELVYARILLQNPRVVFCIQPFKGAEVSMRIRIWELLEQFLDKGIAVVILAVNLADSLALADRLIRLHSNGGQEEYAREDFEKLPVTTPWLYLYQKGME